MSKPDYFNHTNLTDFISDYEEKKSRFKLVLEKLIDFKKEQAAGKAGYQAELAKMQKQVKEEYQQTFDDSVFDKLEQFKTERGMNSGKTNAKELALHEAATGAAHDLSRADAIAAEAGAQSWAIVADDVLEAAEKAVITNMATVLYLRRKMNNGNYPENNFFSQVGLDDLQIELERVYKDYSGQIDELKKSAIDKLPDIPRAKTITDHPLRIIDLLNGANIGTSAHPWKGVTVENLVREV